MESARRTLAAATAAVILLILTSQISPLSAQTGDALPPCLKGPGFLYPHPENCSLYRSCQYGVYSTHECQGHSSFSELLGACVPFNSLFDYCARKNAPRICWFRRERNITEPLVIPHSQACMVYFYCVSTPERYAATDVCSYPDQYDMTERKCKPFKESMCGPHREEYKEACRGYIGSSYAHEECERKYPSCLGLADGFYGHPHKLWTSSFILCDTERFMNESHCSMWNGLPRKFHAERRQCVTVWEIPREHGGSAPSCEGLGSGFHPVREQKEPTVYFQCPDETAYFCDPGFVFKTELQACGKPE